MTAERFAKYLVKLDKKKNFRLPSNRRKLTSREGIIYHELIHIKRDNEILSTRTTK